MAMTRGKWRGSRKTASLLPAAILAVHATEHALGRRQALRRVLGGFLLVGALGTERVRDRVIPLVAAILEDFVVRLTCESHAERPRRYIGRRVVYMQFVVDHL